MRGRYKFLIVVLISITGLTHRVNADKVKCDDCRLTGAPVMKFAKVVFTAAGVYGIVCIAPLYFAEQIVREQSEIAISHPEFFYGFVGVTLSWQIAFLVIAKDPVKYRLLMYPACLEKLSFSAAIAVLYGLGRINEMMLFGAAIDFVLLILFIVCILKTKPGEASTAQNA